MTLFAENVDDIGKVGLGRPGDHIRRGRTLAAHPHVERPAEPKREAAIGFVELHRGYPDIHHDAVDRSDALPGTNLDEVRKPVLDQGEAAVRSVHQIEAAHDGSPVPVDADDAGSSHLENGPAVTAGPKGGIEINA